jgi:hypothetical protein
MKEKSVGLPLPGTSTQPCANHEKPSTLAALDSRANREAFVLVLHDFFAFVCRAVLRSCLPFLLRSVAWTLSNGGATVRRPHHSIGKDDSKCFIDRWIAPSERLEPTFVAGTLEAPGAIRSKRGLSDRIGRVTESAKVRIDRRLVQPIDVCPGVRDGGDSAAGHARSASRQRRPWSCDRRRYAALWRLGS